MCQRTLASERSALSLRTVARGPPPDEGELSATACLTKIRMSSGFRLEHRSLGAASAGSSKRHQCTTTAEGCVMIHIPPDRAQPKPEHRLALLGSAVPGSSSSRALQ